MVAKILGSGSHRYSHLLGDQYRFVLHRLYRRDYIFQSYSRDFFIHWNRLHDYTHKKRNTLSRRLTKTQQSAVSACRTLHGRIHHMGRLDGCHECYRRKIMASQHHRRRRSCHSNYDPLLHYRRLTRRLDRQKNKLLHPTLPITTRVWQVIQTFSLQISALGSLSALA